MIKRELTGKTLQGGGLYNIPISMKCSIIGTTICFISENWTLLIGDDVESLRNWITSSLVGFPDWRRVNWAVTFPFVFCFCHARKEVLKKSLRHWIISQYVLQIWRGLIELSHFTQASNIWCTKYQIQNSCQDILGPLQKWYFLPQTAKEIVKLCTH